MFYAGVMRQTAALKYVRGAVYSSVRGFRMA
jgi:hypothetical protein